MQLERIIRGQNGKLSVADYGSVGEEVERTGEEKAKPRRGLGRN